MRAGMTKNSAGIGGKMECLPCMGSTASITGGSEMQRRHGREYGKKAHAAAQLDLTDVPPVLNISVPTRVL